MKGNRNQQSGRISAKRSVRDPMPRDIQPMLATLVDKPVEGDDWIYELKWDGFRAIAYVENGKAELRSRNNKIFNEKFYPVHAALKNISHNVILDGEILVVNDNGYPDFAAL